MDFDFSGRREARPQEYYDEIKARFAEERDLRLAYRPAGHRAVHVRPRRRAGRSTQVDPYADGWVEREPIDDDGRGAVHRRRLLRAADLGPPARARRREHPHRRARRRRRRHLVLEPLPGRRLRRRRLRLPAAARRDGLRAVAALRRGPGDLRPLPGDRPQLRPLRPRRVPDHGHVDRVGRRTSSSGTCSTDRGDRMRATLRHLRQRHARQAEAGADRRAWRRFTGHSFHTSRWDYDYTGANLENLQDKVVGIIGTGATRGAGDPHLGGQRQGALRLPAHAVVDRHPRRLGDRSASGRPSSSRAGRQARRAKIIDARRRAPSARSTSCAAHARREEKIRRQENAEHRRT